MIKILIDETQTDDKGTPVHIEIHASEHFIMEHFTNAVYRVLKSCANNIDKPVRKEIDLFHGGLLFEHISNGGSFDD